MGALRQFNIGQRGDSPKFFVIFLRDLLKAPNNK